MIEAAIHELLSTRYEIEQHCADRIYHVPLPADVRMPAITYSLQSVDDDHDYDGPGITASDLQIDAWGADPTSAARIAQQINGVLGRFRGDVMGERILGIYRRVVRVAHEPEAGGWRKSQIFEIYHEEAN